LGIDPEAQESITLEIRQTGSGESLATVKWTGMRLGLIRPTVEVAPYALTGGHPGENGFFQSGVDLASHYRNLNLLGSVNPDFRTVERSILSLDFSYFERLAPETRPFFTEGAAYFNPTGFASQRIDDFDAAAKAYGKVDRSTSVAALGGGTVGTDDFVVASVDRRLNDNGNISVGVKSFHGADFDNNYASGSANYTLGPLRFKTDVQLTADQAFGSGSSIDTSILYDKDGYFAHLTGITTSANFLDRLGYYTEPDIKGLNANLGKLLTFKSGSIESVGLSLATSQFTFQNNDPYRNYYSATGSMTIRKGPDITLSHLAGTFLSNKDRVTEGVISQPIQRGRGRVGADITAGQLDSHSYRSALLFLSYAPVPKLRLTGSFQELRHFANETQTILNADYDLGRGESISGRMVQFDNNWSFYLRYRKVQRDGTELQVLFGDPNSPTFDHVIMVKLVLPFTLRF
jgi:hypothetical protein